MRGATALVLDDDKDVCEIIAEVLREEGCEVTTLTNVEGLHALAGFDGFDFGVVDLVMVGSTGGWHVDRITEAGLPAIFISGYMELPKPAPAGYHFLQKPFTAAELLEKARLLLAAPRRPRKGRACR
jgi:DNA-binding NtrC family response regulator